MGDFEKLFSFKAKSELKDVSIRSSSPFLSSKKKKRENSAKIVRAFLEIRKSIVKMKKEKRRKDKLLDRQL